MTVFTSESLAQACDWLDKGNLLAYPTEAVWGIGCDPFNQQAVMDLLTLKNRPIEKGLILITADTYDVRYFLDNLPKNKQRHKEILKSWNSPNNTQATTWLFPIPQNLKYPIPDWVTGGHENLAIRSLEALEHISVLCRKFAYLRGNHPENPYNFLVSTSCNPSGKPPATTLQQAQNYFKNYPNVGYFMSRTLGYTQPSQIKNALTGELVRE